MLTDPPIALEHYAGKQLLEDEDHCCPSGPNATAVHTMLRFWTSRKFEYN